MNKRYKKGGLDTIVAYIVVSIPLFYVLIYMIATLYHFSVQMYINQTIKETLVMASSKGELTDGMHTYMLNRLNNIAPIDQWHIRYGIRPLINNKSDPDYGTVGDYSGYSTTNNSLDTFGTFRGPTGIMKTRMNANNDTLKGDLMGIQVTSVGTSLLGTVSSFGMFLNPEADVDMHYTAFREEIIRSDP